MKIVLVLILLQAITLNEFDDTMEKLELLENYISQYIKEKKSGRTLTELVTTYIREGRYGNLYWNILLWTSSPDDLDEYLQKKEKEHNKKVREIRNYTTILLPNKEKFDFAHLFATMNGIYIGKEKKTSIKHLVGWGGDTVTLVEDIKKESGIFDNLDKLIEKANEFFNHKGQFGPEDLISDLDAPILIVLKESGTSFSKIIKQYYSDNGLYNNRINLFLKYTFTNYQQINLKDRDKFRDYIFKIYSNDIYITILETKKNVIEYDNHRKAGVYAFADYLWYKINKIEEIECDINHILIGNNCIKKINNCVEYYANGSCKSCNYNYILSNNACFKKINNCASYNSNGSCKSCNYNYILQNNICNRVVRKMEQMNLNHNSTKTTKILKNSSLYISFIFFAFICIIILHLIYCIIQKKKVENNIKKNSSIKINN